MCSSSFPTGSNYYLRLRYAAMFEHVLIEPYIWCVTLQRLYGTVMSHNCRTRIRRASLQETLISMWMKQFMHWKNRVISALNVKLLKLVGKFTYFGCYISSCILQLFLYEQRATRIYKNISLILFSRGAHGLLVWEIDGVTYPQRGDFFLFHIFLQEAGGASCIVRDASDRLPITGSAPNSLDSV